MKYPVLDVKATGNRIKELRRERNLKVIDIAEFMGFESEQAVYKWQRGESLPTVDNLFALCRLFGTTAEDILIEDRKGESDGSLLPLLKRLQCLQYPKTGNLLGLFSGKRKLSYLFNHHVNYMEVHG